MIISTSSAFLRAAMPSKLLPRAVWEHAAVRVLGGGAPS
jgi:hypothetical protein